MPTYADLLLGLITMFPVLLVALIAYFQGEVKDWENASRVRIWSGLIIYQNALTALSWGTGGVAFLLVQAVDEAATSLHLFFSVILVGVVAFLLLNLLTVSSRAAKILNARKVEKKRQKQEQLDSAEPSPESDDAKKVKPSLGLSAGVVLVGAIPSAGLVGCIVYVVYQVAIAVAAKSV